MEPGPLESTFRLAPLKMRSAEVGRREETAERAVVAAVHVVFRSADANCRRFLP